jgi:transcriptional regulator with GAF, ATPase, and Fis domain
LDAALPEGFWADLSVRSGSSLALDGVCVLAELFCRLRLLSLGDVRERFTLAEECIATATGDGDSPITEVLRTRVELTLSALSDGGASLRETDLQRAGAMVRTGQVPGYVSGTALYAAISTDVGNVSLFQAHERSTALELIRTTGNPSDSRVQISGLFTDMVFTGLLLLTREIADEQLVLLESRAPHRLRHNVARNLQALSGRRVWSISAGTLLLRHASLSRESAADRTFEASWMSRALLNRGDFAGAEDALSAALARATRHPWHLVHALQAELALAVRSLSWSKTDDLEVEIRQSRKRLPTPGFEHLRSLVRAITHLRTGEWKLATRAFRDSRRALENLGPALSGSLRRWPAEAERLLGCVRDYSAANVGSQTQVEPLLERIIRLARKRGAISTGYGAVARSLEIIVSLLEATASRLAATSVLRVGVFLHRAVSTWSWSRRGSFWERLAEYAPRYFARLDGELRSRVGTYFSGAPSVRAVSSALRALGTLWADDAVLRRLVRCTLTTQELRIRRAQSQARRAREHHRLWKDDVTSYAALCERAANIVGQNQVRLRTFGYLSERLGNPRQLELVGEITNLGSSSIGVRVSRTTSTSATRSLAPSRRKPRRIPDKDDVAPRFSGASSEAEEVRRFIDVASRCSHAVLIVGETGTGKDLIARAIHARSSRGQSPLVIADCGSIPDSLLESELFGHRKGAFTSAVTDHAGCIERAHNTTLFLDETDSMSPRLQAALLRVIDAGEYRRLGGRGYHQSDFRVIAAALPAFFEKLRSGDYREDLYYRLSTLQLEVPPLRDRGDDAWQLASEYASSRGCDLRAVAACTIRAYEWPGNVRQLRHCIDAASAFAPSGVITDREVSRAIATYERRQAGARTPIQELWEGVKARLDRRAPFAAADFAKAVSVSRRTAQRRLADLVKQGIVRRTGSGRATRYLADGATPRPPIDEGSA